MTDPKHPLAVLNGLVASAEDVAKRTTLELQQHVDTLADATHPEHQEAIALLGHANRVRAMLSEAVQSLNLVPAADDELTRKAIGEIKISLDRMPQVSAGSRIHLGNTAARIGELSSIAKRIDFIDHFVAMGPHGHGKGPNA